MAFRRLFSILVRMKRIDISVLRASGEKAPEVASDAHRKRIVPGVPSEDQVARMDGAEVVRWIEQAESDVKYLETQLAVLEKFPAYFSTHLLGQATHAQKEELSRMMGRYAGYQATLKAKLSEAREGLARMADLRVRLRAASSG